MPTRLHDVGGSRPRKPDRARGRPPPCQENDSLPASTTGSRRPRSPRSRWRKSPPALMLAGSGLDVPAGYSVMVAVSVERGPVARDGEVGDHPNGAGRDAGPTSCEICCRAARAVRVERTGETPGPIGRVEHPYRRGERDDGVHRHPGHPAYRRTTTPLHTIPYWCPRTSHPRSCVPADGACRRRRLGQDGAERARRRPTRRCRSQSHRTRPMPPASLVS